MVQQSDHDMSDTFTPLPFSFAKKHRVLLSTNGADGQVLVYVAPLSPLVVSEVRRTIGRGFDLRVVDESAFEQWLAKAYALGGDEAVEAISGIEESYDLNALMQELPATEDLLDAKDDAPVIRLLNAILTQGLHQGATDIHVETFESKFLIRFRIDGMMHEVLSPPRALSSLITSRLKIMAKLDIAEKRLPQDGRINLRIAGRAVDVRISSIPTYYGERIVLRILDKQSTPLELTQLGMGEQHEALMQKLISRPNGIVLVTGPTGSGKTTTLYAALEQLNQAERNILTVEDPIEYYLEGIGQTQVNAKIGMTFARGLRALLRQDPDVVMVGEIRDVETAQMAVQASLTGHMVFSTLHTNSAVGAIARLRDMGVEPFLLASTVAGLVSQRLVRQLCPDCKRPVRATMEQLQVMGLVDRASTPATPTTMAVKLVEPVGCDACGQTGYRGRKGIYEVIAMDATLQSMIHDGDSEQDMRAYAHKTYMPIEQSGWRAVLRGETAFDEVLRVVCEGEMV